MAGNGREKSPMERRNERVLHELEEVQAAYRNEETDQDASDDASAANPDADEKNGS